VIYARVLQQDAAPFAIARIDEHFKRLPLGYRSQNLRLKMLSQMIFGGLSAAFALLAAGFWWWSTKVGVPAPEGCENSCNSDPIRVLCMLLINHVNRLAGKGSRFARKMTPPNRTKSMRWVSLAVGS
jgi:hypothetical protein